MDLGTVLHYQVLSRIGSGGMGVVFKALDTKLNRTVALKLLPASLSHDSNAKARLIREARAASALDHHNIATVYDICEADDGGVLMAMAYYEGRTLAEVIEAGPVSVDDAVQYVAQVADGLSEAHRSGVIHCDIKPANLLVTPRGVVKILDFGIARLTQQSVASTTGVSMAGTLPYMSPEQLNGSGLDERTDLWSLGVVLYELLTGAAPFRGDAGATIAAILNHEPPPLRSTRNDVPQHVEGVVTQALSKSAGARFSSASDLAAALRSQSRIQHAAPRPATRVIVLPFRMLRPDPEIDFLTFSLSDAITGSLINLQTLQVCSSATAARFQAADLDLTGLRRETGAELVLRGTLIRAGAKVRVQAQLLESSNGTALWSETTDVVFSDLFALQDELTRRIVAGLTVPLSAHDQRQLGRDVPASAAAFEDYLRANQLAQQMTSWSEARALYEQCLRRDPRYAPAWARLGRVYWLMGKYVAAESADNMARARAAFESALSLNEELALAHHLFTPLQVDIGQGRDALVRLLRLAASRGRDAEVFAGLVHACRYCGLLDASLRADARAREIDPRMKTSVMQTRFQRREYDHVAVQDIAAFPVIVGCALIQVGRPLEAARKLAATQWKDHHLHDFAEAIEALARDDLAASRHTIRRMLASGFRAPEELFHLARLLSQLDCPEQAVETLNRAIDGGFCPIRAFERDAWLAPLRATTGFEEAFLRASASHATAVEAYRLNGGVELLGPAD
jgi:serine/threonine protein kinase